MGSKKGDKRADDDEYGNPDKLTIPYDYWLARYPVTVAQVDAFVQGNGYQEKSYWTDAGWQWREKERRI